MQGTGSLREPIERLWRWLSNDADLVRATPAPARDRVDWLRATPFLAFHAACLQQF